MSIEPLNTSHFPVAGPGTAAGARATAGKAFAEALSTAQVQAVAGGTGDEPSTEALAAVQTAARAYEHLRETGRELHFKATDTGMQIEVYDGTGRLVQRIPPNEALALAAAKGTAWLA